ncbi:MAG TPA: TIGR03435 family protein [Bryobacteraceae bacterium]|nr:TIGR03435 family protein [Bryobacteraceae bacterium]
MRAGYALVIDKKGPKFRESDPNSPSTRAHAGQATFGAGPGVFGIKCSMTTVSLARFVSNRRGVPVEDLTGLNVSWASDRSIEKMGRFAQDYAAAHPDWADNAAGLPQEDIFTSFRNSLGLRLEPRKEPLDVIVIDQIEQIPTAN